MAAALALVAGIELLRLRTWARTALQAVCWLGVVELVGFAAFSRAMAEGLEIDTLRLALLMGLPALGLLGMIAFLRTRVVRDTVDGGRPGR